MAYRIVVCGDSFTAQQALLGPSWPELLSQYLKASGADVEVINVAINGYSYFRANTEAAFGSQTMLNKVISLQPNMVICALNHNDLGSGRTLTQIKQDADTFFNTLRSSLPSATVVYASSLTYDRVHAPNPNTLVNRQVLPIFMQRPTSGILSGCVCGEMLPNAVGADIKTRYVNWNDFDAYIKAKPQINTWFTLEIWKAARLGLSGVDGAHLTAAGSRFLAACAREAFRTNSVLAAQVPNLSRQDFPAFNDANGIFNALLSDNGTEYLTRPFDTSFEHTVENFGPFRVFNTDNWFFPSKGTFTSTPLSAYVHGSVFAWSVRGVRFNSQVQTSVNGSAWNNEGVTNSQGDYQNAAIFTPTSLPSGSYTLRYRFGDEVHGPVVLNVL